MYWPAHQPASTCINLHQAASSCIKCAHCSVGILNPPPPASAGESSLHSWPPAELACLFSWHTWQTDADVNLRCMVASSFTRRCSTFSSLSLVSTRRCTTATSSLASVMSCITTLTMYIGLLLLLRIGKEMYESLLLGGRCDIFSLQKIMKIVASPILLHECL